jgi:hypothetical protein
LAIPRNIEKSDAQDAFEILTGMFSRLLTELKTLEIAFAETGYPVLMRSTSPVRRYCR